MRGTTFEYAVPFSPGLPERPIPSGVITSREVYRYGFMFLGAGLVVLTLLVVGGVARVGAVVTAGILGLAVVLYDAWHKSNPINPVLMGACRALLYVTASLATFGSVGSGVWLGALGLLGYVVGLSYGAKSRPLCKAPPKRRVWPLAMLASPLLFVLLHYWSTLTLLATAALALWMLRSLRHLR